MGEQPGHVHPMPLKFCIAEICHKSLLTNGVHRHDISPASAFWDWMMPDRRLSDRPAAQPTDYSSRDGFLVRMWVYQWTMFRMLAGHAFIQLPNSAQIGNSVLEPAGRAGRKVSEKGTVVRSETIASSAQFVD